MIVEKFQQDAKAIAQGGRECIEAAKSKGISAVYEDVMTGRIVEEMPDGTIRPLNPGRYDAAATGLRP